jgi:penicillin-binding protein 1A
MLRWLGFTFGFFILLLLGGLGSTVLLLYYFGRNLPDYKQLAEYEPPVVTRLYSGNGELMKEYAIENRVFMPLNLVPKKVVHAFLAAEDKNFFIHPGIDPFGMGRALVSNILNRGRKRPQGASTISQQVARNFFLSNEVSMGRKIKEIILTFRIEQALTKERILELYLNKIYLGLGAYGVTTASLFYFNKSLDELTFGEAAYLAVLPKAPNNYHPVQNKEAAYNRRAWVLGRMAEAGYITKAQADEAKKEPLTIYTKTTRDEHLSDDNADYYAEDVRRRLHELYGQEGLYKGGLYVSTPMDVTLQKYASLALKKGLILYDRRHGWRGPIKSLGLKNRHDWLNTLKKEPDFQGLYPTWKQALVLDINPREASIGFRDGTESKLAFEGVKWTNKGSLKQVFSVGNVIAVEPILGKDQLPTGKYSLQQIPEVNGGLAVLDPNTGRVLALSGGFSYDLSQFNRATQGMRQTGSVIKPLVYYTGLENGFTPVTKVLDGPITVHLGQGLPPWSPRNYGAKFYGVMPFRRCVEKSLNSATVRVALKVGMDKIADNGEKLGLYDHMMHRFSAVLGAQETTVLKMANAYAHFVNGGKRVTPTLIDRIQNRHGKTVYRHHDQECKNCSFETWNNDEMPELQDVREQIIDPGVAYQMVSILSGVIERGTAAKIKYFARPIAGKTGTANEFMTAWFVGFIPDLAFCCNIGFDKPKSLGNGEAGSRAALPIMEEFLKLALPAITPKPFRVPSGVRLIKIDPMTGSTVDASSPGGIYEAFKPGTEPDEFKNDESVLDTGEGSVDPDHKVIVGNPSNNLAPFTGASPPNLVGVY